LFLLPVIEADKIFWQPDLAPMGRERWTEVQRQLTNRESWIIEGDLGPYDAVEIRLRSADTIIFLDFSLLRCAWRALRRSGERLDFWIWLMRYRHQSRPFLMRMIAEHAPRARLDVLRSPLEVDRFFADVERSSRD
jgi:adenylate kinase family enzyme